MIVADTEQDMSKDVLKFTQITVNSFTVWGLDEQGHVWRYADTMGGWVKLLMVVAEEKKK